MGNQKLLKNAIDYMTDRACATIWNGEKEMFVEIIKLLKKGIISEVLPPSKHFGGIAKCPNCMNILDKHTNYCPHCGQALKFTNKEE